MDNATSIWVDLLIHDAALQADHVHNVDIDLEGIDILDNSLVQSPSHFGDRTTGAFLAPEEVGKSPTSSNPLLQERTTSVIEFEALEKKEWHSASPISLTSSEVVLFQHFVRKLSQWVSWTMLCCSIYYLTRRVLLIVIDYSSWTCSTPGNLSRPWYHTWRQVVSPKILARVGAAKTG